jgi:hypothetical protein
MAMVVGPTPDHGVELGYQMGRGCLLVGLHDFPDLTQECLDILLGGFSEEFTRILPDMVAQKIKAVLDVRDAGFLRGEFEPTLVKELLYQRFDFMFQQFIRAAGNDEI